MQRFVGRRRNILSFRGECFPGRIETLSCRILKNVPVHPDAQCYFQLSPGGEFPPPPQNPKFPPRKTPKIQKMLKNALNLPPRYVFPPPPRTWSLELTLPDARILRGSRKWNTQNCIRYSRREYIRYDRRVYTIE